MEGLAALHCDHSLTFPVRQRFRESLCRPVSSTIVSLSPSSLSFVVSSCSSSSPLSTSDPSLQISTKSEPFPSQGMNHFPKLASVAAMTSTSALFLLRFCQRNLVRCPMILPLIASIGKSVKDESFMTEFMEENTHLVHSVRYCKLKVKAQIVDDILKSDAEAWTILKDQVSGCKAELDRLIFGFEAILERDPGGNRFYHNNVLEQLENVDECKALLKKIFLGMDECERCNLDLKHNMKLFTSRIARVKALKEESVVALKRFQELEKVEQQMVRTFYTHLWASSGDSSLIKILPSLG